MGRIKTWEKLRTELGAALIDDTKNKRIFCISTFVILGLVALFMTIMNVLTHKGFLTVATGVFTVLCAANLLLTLLSIRGRHVAMFLFSVEVVVMFTYFLISGNPEGFSAIWICMLPALGMLFFGRKFATVLCAVMMAILVFLLWLPVGNALLQYRYTDSFMMRFPVLFTAFFLLSFFLETLRLSTANEMKRLQQLYRELSIKDSLTGMLNRQGMYSAIEEDKKYRKAESLGVAMFDIDFFKQVNDTYGHNAGDLILKGFSRIISENLNALVCRWGGEEFVAVFIDNDVLLSDLNHVRELIAQEVFSFEGQDIRITASIGLHKTAYFSLDDLDSLIECADSAMYEAKNTGKNKVVVLNSAE